MGGGPPNPSSSPLRGFRAASQAPFGRGAGAAGPKPQKDDIMVFVKCRRSRLKLRKNGLNARGVWLKGFRVTCTHEEVVQGEWVCKSQQRRGQVSHRPSRSHARYDQKHRKAITLWICPLAGATGKFTLLAEGSDPHLAPQKRGLPYREG